jgi:uncharacterized protein (DUF983 family)
MSDTDSAKSPKPNYFTSILSCKCPRCRRGNMYLNKVSISGKKNMAMPEKCPVCGQPMELEVGFYYGTGYVSYALTVAISVATFLAFWAIYGISIDDNSLYIWLVLNVIVLVIGLPYIMRLSRTLWLSFFVSYDPDWQIKEPPKPERIVKEQMGNW